MCWTLSNPCFDARSARVSRSHKLYVAAYSVAGGNPGQLDAQDLKLPVQIYGPLGRYLQSSARMVQRKL